jgi:hypothetical protein
MESKKSYGFMESQEKFEIKRGRGDTRFFWCDSLTIEQVNSFVRLASSVAEQNIERMAREAAEKAQAEADGVIFEPREYAKTALALEFENFVLAMMVERSVDKEPLSFEWLESALKGNTGVHASDTLWQIVRDLSENYLTAAPVEEAIEGVTPEVGEIPKANSKTLTGRTSKRGSPRITASNPGI